jgi:hypothetical protein
MSMAVVLGPTFGAEVIAAGLGGLPFAWGTDGGISGRESLTPAQNATLDAVIAAHDPSKAAVPSAVSPLQARRALRQSGLLDKVTAAVATATPDLQDAWSYAGEIRRDSAALKQVATQLGLTSSAVDDLFRLAATLSDV